MKKYLALILMFVVIVLGGCNSSDSKQQWSEWKSPDFSITYPEGWFIYPYDKLLNSLNQNSDFAKTYNEYTNKFGWDNGSGVAILFRDPLNEIGTISVRMAKSDTPMDIDSLDSSESKVLLEVIGESMKKQINSTDGVMLKNNIYKGKRHSRIVIAAIGSDPFNPKSSINSIISMYFKGDEMYTVGFTSSNSTGKEFIETNYKKILDSFDLK